VDLGFHSEDDLEGPDMTAKKKEDTTSAKSTQSARLSWMDDKSDTPMIQAYTERLRTFLDAMADGKIDSDELKAQEKRLVALLKKIEPELDDRLHEEVTHLLCELTAYNIMHTVHDLAKHARPRTKFRG
jgi:hypothetical protein